MGGLSLLFKLKLNEFHFCKQCCLACLLVLDSGCIVFKVLEYIVPGLL